MDVDVRNGGKRPVDGLLRIAYFHGIGDGEAMTDGCGVDSSPDSPDRQPAAFHSNVRERPLQRTKAYTYSCENLHSIHSLVLM
jgi:hypothetical protein